jgi:predicted DNA-binding transcriptional regulator
MMRMPEFRFLTNHGNALLLVARDPRIRISDIASLLDITERAARRVVADLTKSGYLDREKDGRRSVYRVKTDLPLHLPFQRDRDIKSLLELLANADTTGSSR